MSDNVGLSTPRGSGTSGYVQRNRAFIRPRDNAYGGPHGSNPRDLLASQQASRLRQPDQGILEHDRKRAIEVRVFALRDQLEEQGDLADDTIDQRCDALRTKLTEEAQRPGGGGPSGGGANGGGDGRQRFKAHQVHEQARAKIVESERLRRALRINKDYQEGGHWRRQDEKQAQKRKMHEEGAGEDEGTTGSRTAAPSAAAAAAAATTTAKDKRRRRYSDDNDDDKDDAPRPRGNGGGGSDGYDSYEEGEVGRPGRRASPPLKSVEGDYDDRRGARGGRRAGGDATTNQKAASRGRGGDYSDESDSGEVAGHGGQGSRDAAPRGRAQRDSRSPRSASRSRSRNRGRGRNQSYSRSPSRSRSRSRRRSRSESQDSR